MSSDPAHADNDRNDGRSLSRTGLGGIIVISVVVAMLTGIVAGSLAAWAIMGRTQSAPIVAAQTPLITYAQEAEASAAAVYQAVAPSVVTILVRDDERPGQMGTGTGIIIDEQGHILTNNHVISDVDRVLVQLLDGRTVFADIIGRDPGTDLAVIRAKFPPGTLNIARFGDSQAVQPGDPVFAIGAPYGLSHSITAGIVSGVGRTYLNQGRRVRGAIQSDASINPGNSGGPLLNAKGEVIGITTAIQTTSEVFMGVGLSIPSNLVQSLLPRLIKGEDMRRTYLGVRMTTITPREASARNLDIEQGVWVLQAMPGGPAQKAGIRGSPSLPSADIITAIDGVPVKTAGGLIAYIQTKDVGDTITVTVYRNGETLEIPVTLGAWPQR